MDSSDKVVKTELRLALEAENVRRGYSAVQAMDHLKISHQTYYAVANGTQPGSDNILDRIADYIGCSTTEARKKQGTKRTIVIKNSRSSDIQDGPVKITPSSTPVNRQKRNIWTVVFASACMLLVFGIYKTVFSNTKFSLSNYCMLDFRKLLETALDCRGDVEFEITSNTLDGWNTRISNIFVPNSWDVTVFYETYIPPDYKVSDPDKKGYVDLVKGYNPLNTLSYAVYDDHLRTKLKKESIAKELNDRVQFLIIRNSSVEPLKIMANDKLDDDEVLLIKRTR